jgi:hypothetical protein
MRKLIIRIQNNESKNVHCMGKIFGTILMSVFLKAFILVTAHPLLSCLVYMTEVNGTCIQKFSDWPPGARTANVTALCTRCSCIAIL